MRYIALLDIGGSGIKVALYNNVNRTYRYHKLRCNTGEYSKMKGIHHILERLIMTLLGRYDIDCVGLSTAGNIHGDIVERWGERYNIVKMLKLRYNTYVLNDAEAHMRYCMATYPTIMFPALCLALGTGVALSVADGKKNIVKTEDHYTLDNVKISSTERNVHDLLGQRGIDGIESYYKHMRRFLRLFVPFFNARTVFFGGGVAQQYNFTVKILPKLQEEFHCIIIPGNSALLGMFEVLRP